MGCDVLGTSSSLSDWWNDVKKQSTFQAEDWHPLGGWQCEVEADRSRAILGDMTPLAAEAGNLNLVPLRKGTLLPSYSRVPCNHFTCLHQEFKKLKNILLHL